MYPLPETWRLSAPFYDATPAELFHLALRTPVTLNVIDHKGKKGEPDTRTNVLALPGHLWDARVGGLTQAKVMVVGKMPGREELQYKRNFVGPTGRELRRVFEMYDAPTDDVYVTNVLRFIPPSGSTKLTAHHIADCAALLAQEIIEVGPSFMLLLGADAVKFVFGKKATLGSVRSAKLPLHPNHLGQFPDRFSDDDMTKALFDRVNPIIVMATQHPAQVLREPSLTPGMEGDIEVFLDMAFKSGSKSMVSLNKKCNYRYIDNAADLDVLVDELIEKNVTELSIDCEWGGEHFKDGWLRTIQFSWAPGEAAVVILRTAESQRTPIFKPTMYHAIQALRRLIDREGVKIYGQNFRSDALWLEDLGLPVMRRLSFDTMLADHAMNESQPHGLTALAIRHTTLGRYDFELESWLKRNPQPKGVGYANVPNHMLHVYGATDADAVFRIVQVQRKMLDRPENVKIKKLFETIIMPANQPIHEMEMVGIGVDPDRMTELFWHYNERKNELLDDVRNITHWPAFNPRSYKMKTKLLFGKPADGGLGLIPIKTTGKPAKEWVEVLQMAPAARAMYNPSTDSESLELLSQTVPEDCYADQVIGTLKDYQTIDQITKNFLRAPDGYTGEEDDDEFCIEDFSSGLAGNIKDNGRIHTTISQIKETGRHSSRRPALQNISKKMEPIYRRIMGWKIPKIRSCFKAREGYVIIESDYKSAEVVSLAYVSGDENLIADATGPVKLHAKVAVDVFGAPCEYSEVAEKYPYYYVGAKNINFGIPYQRGAKAIARQVNRDTEGKAGMTEDQARGYIDGWYERYPRVRGYVDYCKWCVNEQGYMDTPLGRRRHFYKVDNKGVMAGQERECVNFGIQAVVADALNMALYNIWAYKQQHPECDFNIMLAIHDSVLLEVPVENVEHVMDFMLPACMARGVTIPATERSQEFKLDIDPEISLRWGESPTRDEMSAVGVPEKYWPEAA
jgi:uracil-DNA glycosylase family 4